MSDLTTQLILEKSKLVLSISALTGSMKGCGYWVRVVSLANRLLAMEPLIWLPNITQLLNWCEMLLTH